MIAKLKVRCECGKENFIEVNPAQMLGKHASNNLSKKERILKAIKASHARKNYKRKIKIRT